MTILISIENGFSSRYLLRTGILRQLLAQKLPIVVASPNAHEEYFRQSLEAMGARVIPQPTLSAPVPNNIRDKLERIRYYGMPHTTRSDNIDVKYRQYLARKPMRPAVLAGFRFGVSAHRHSRVVRRGVEAIGQTLDLSAYRDILRRERVKLLVLDGIGDTGPRVANWSRAARGICPAVTVITNWDHPTTKGYRGRATERYLVWGAAMARELEHYQDVPPERITQLGSALFDVYATPDALWDRAQVCSHFRLDPVRQIVLYISNSPVNFPYNFEIARFLANRLAEMPGSPQLLVRLHPLFAQAAAAPERAKHCEFAKCPGVAYSMPEVWSVTLLPDMSAQEIQLAASLVANADVVVNLFSTMQLDACICDKPIVNISFDWGSDSNGSQQASLFHNYSHLKRIVTSGAVEIARDRRELTSLIQQGLASPNVHSTERRKYVQQEIGILDGGATTRVVREIQSLF